ncbi:MAG TPA: ABC transporter permease [Streptosporangiaceae bacterium]|nr:ABC transporter permease [Streptosporangiaceae bacterium]
MPANRPALVQEGAPPGAAARLVSVPMPAAAQAASVTAMARPQGRRSNAGGRRATAWLRLISPVTVLVVWQLVSQLGLVSEQTLPSPTHVWSTAVSLVTQDSPAYGTLQGNLVVSLERVAIGFAVGASIGLLLAVIAGLSRLGENTVDPLMQMLRTLPLFGLIPVFIVWFGIDNAPKIILIALGAAIPLYLNAFAGIRNVDPKLHELSRVLRLTRRELITKIVLPGAMPQILVGIRQSLGVAWLALVVAEQINTNAGLGFMMSQATQFLRLDVIIVALLVYCVLGLLTDWLVRIAERRALSWRRSFIAA